MKGGGDFEIPKIYILAVDGDFDGKNGDGQCRIILDPYMEQGVVLAKIWFIFRHAVKSEAVIVKMDFQGETFLPDLSKMEE